MTLTCSFCGSKLNNKIRIHQGAVANICDSCLEVLSSSEREELDINKTSMDKVMKPKEIKEELDKYIIGQEQAKKILSVEVYNHYKRLNNKSKNIIEKTNIMLVGPSGSGKTYLVQTLAEILDAPFVIADATGLTEAGYVGKDTESMLGSLIEKCNGDISKAEKGIIYIDEIDKIVSRGPDIGRNRDVGGEGVQQSLLTMMEGSEMLIEIPDPVLRKKTVTINTKNILFICGGAFIGIDEIVKNRLNPTTKKKVGFQLPTVSSIDNTVLKLIDNIVVNKLTKVEPVDIVKYGFIKEFVGRVPLIATLQNLSEDELISILTKVHNSVIKQYQTIFKMDHVKLKFDKDALDYIAKEALKMKVGARGLKGILADKMNELQYEMHSMDIKEYVVTKEYLESK